MCYLEEVVSLAHETRRHGLQVDALFHHVTIPHQDTVHYRERTQVELDQRGGKYGRQEQEEHSSAADESTLFKRQGKQRSPNKDTEEDPVMSTYFSISLYIHIFQHIIISTYISKYHYIYIYFKILLC